jgi:hypothetical protein|tara:strand:+ start:2938 stop:3117 length:180 start_codon:yes stop_codon:yes gene_type:complete
MAMTAMHGTREIFIMAKAEHGRLTVDSEMVGSASRVIITITTLLVNITTSVLITTEDND